MNHDYSTWIQKVLKVASRASQAILEIYLNNNYHVRSKSDKSPVTEADLLSHQIIESGLREIDPNIPIISEEGKEIPYEVRSKWPMYWCVDPLDGTKEFIQRTDEFTINIALIENGSPILGVVAVPVHNQYYWAIKGQQAYLQIGEGEGVQPQVIQCRDPLGLPIRIIKSRRAMDASWEPFLNRLPAHEITLCGSSVKFCLIAKGDFDIYPQFGETGEWDTAAPQCILEAAGGKVVNLHGESLLYNTKPSLMNPKFCAISNVDLLSYIVDKS